MEEGDEAEQNYNEALMAPILAGHSFEFFGSEFYHKIFATIRDIRYFPI